MKKGAISAALLLFLFFVSPLGAQNVFWISGGEKSPQFALSTAIAKIINENSGGITVNVIPGGIYLEPAYDLVNKGETELGWGMSYWNKAAMDGTPPLKNKYENLRAIAGWISPRLCHFIVDAKIPFKSVDDIFMQKRFPRIAVTIPTTDGDYIFSKIFEHYKMDYNAWEEVTSKFSRGLTSAVVFRYFKERKVDAVFTILDMPTTAVTEASVNRSLRILNFPLDLLKTLNNYGIESEKIKPGTYPKAANANEEVDTAAAGRVIITNKNLSDDIAYRITKAIHENLGMLRNAHQSLAGYELKNAIKGTGIPLHPGAVKYYKEKGVM